MLNFIRPLVNGVFIFSPFAVYYQNRETLNSRFKVWAEPKVGETVLTKRLNKFSNPRPIQIAQRLANGRLWINMQDLNEIFDKVGRNEVGVYAICGPSRTGKSFILTRCAEYLLSSDVKSDSENSAETKACTPFKWNNQKDPITSGIWIWSEPLPVVLPDGKKVYVVLVDCQGCFDESTSINEDANIFAFATLLSSVQIFNIKHQIDESTLQFLELFTGIARRIKLTCLKGSSKPSDVSFQTLTILVRDFQLQGYDYGYHNASGPLATANYKVDKLDPKSHQPLSHQRERSNIITSYQECGVFLQPHPGKKFTASDDPKDLDEDFLQVEKEFLDVLFNPTNIVVKTVNGATQNGTTLKTHVEHWAEELENSELPELPRTLESVNRLQFLDNIQGAKHKYREEMELYLRGHQFQIPEEDLHKKHKSLVEEIVPTFSKHLILYGGNEHERKFEVETEKNLREIYENMQDKNLLKTIHRWYHYVGSAITWVVGPKVGPVVGTVAGAIIYYFLKFSGFF